MSAIELLTTSVHRAVVGELHFHLGAVAALGADQIEPLTLSTVARTRTICGACAAANETASRRATALAPANFRVNIVIIVLPMVVSSCRWSATADGFETPDLPGYSGASAGGRAQIGFEKRP